ncbi:hypothetical protein QTN25_008927 [Entamoeba marina]
MLSITINNYGILNIFNKHTYDLSVETIADISNTSDTNLSHNNELSDNSYSKPNIIDSTPIQFIDELYQNDNDELLGSMFETNESGEETRYSNLLQIQFPMIKTKVDELFYWTSKTKCKVLYDTYKHTSFTESIKTISKVRKVMYLIFCDEFVFGSYHKKAFGFENQIHADKKHFVFQLLPSSHIYTLANYEDISFRVINDPIDTTLLSIPYCFDFNCDSVYFKDTFSKKYNVFNPPVFDKMRSCKPSRVIVLKWY